MELREGYLPRIKVVDSAWSNTLAAPETWKNPEQRSLRYHTRQRKSNGITFNFNFYGIFINRRTPFVQRTRIRSQHTQLPTIHRTFRWLRYDESSGCWPTRPQHRPIRPKEMSSILQRPSTRSGFHQRLDQKDRQYEDCHGLERRSDLLQRKKCPLWTCG